MTAVLLPLCNTGKIAMRDGYTGRTAHIILPFYEFGFWFASGQQYDFPASEVGQEQGMLLIGTEKPNVFQKDCCACLAG